MIKEQDVCEAFLDKLAVAKCLLKDIAVHLDDHMLLHPKDVKWSDVGSASKVCEDLKEIHEFLNLT